MATVDSIPDVVACEICGGPATLAADVRGYRHHRCRRCAHLFVWPRPAQEAVETVYGAEHYYDHAMGQRERLEVDAIHRLELLERLCAAHGLAQRLLDVGCAAGLFLAHATRRGWDAVGIERSAHMAAQAEHAAKAPVHTGLIESMRVPGSPFPVVTAWEVLEHAIDPRAFLRAVARNVAPGGLLALSTPRSDGVPARLMGSRFPMICPPEHLSLFSRRSLGLLAREEGLVEVEFSSFSNLGVESLASGFCRMFRGGPLREAGKVSQAMFLAMGVAACWAPSLIDRAGYGTEMLAIYRKGAP